MRKPGLRVVAVVGVCLGSIGHPIGAGVSDEERGTTMRFAGTPPDAPSMTQLVQSTSSIPRQSPLVANSDSRPRTGPVVWRPEPGEDPPFGLIPTTCTAHPQLLPTTWDVRTIPASEPIAPQDRRR